MSVSKFSVVALGGIAALLIAAGEGELSAPDGVVSPTGEISLPDDFRGRYVHLGSWFVPDGEASGFHDVYANPEAVRGYRKTGQFPDGTVLVKELRSATSGTYTTGQNVRRANDHLKQWFVMVKDSKDRFSGDPRWGNGWGWALFPGDAPAKNAATDFRKDCLGCHAPAAAQDWIYVEAYPTLRPR